MELVGVADVGFDYRVMTAVERGYPVYAVLADRGSDMEAAGIPLAGNLGDLLGDVDVIVDCTPKKIGAANKETYVDAGVKDHLPGWRVT